MSLPGGYQVGSSKPESQRVNLVDLQDGKEVYTMVLLIGIGRINALGTLRLHPFNEATTREAHGGQSRSNP